MTSPGEGSVRNNGNVPKPVAKTAGIRRVVKSRTKPATPGPPPHNVPAAASSSWLSLVNRSIKAWETNVPSYGLVSDLLRTITDLDAFFSSPSFLPMFWFFQRRDVFLSQKTMAKWSRDRLDDYVLLPAVGGFVMRYNSFFVSHFWITPDEPDPGGKYLRLLQEELRQQEWSYVWVDWTCLPQYPRTETESAYFMRGLETMPAIIRNCGFIYFYPPWEARLWILYELIQYMLTCDNRLPETGDVKEFLCHIREMQDVGVRPTLTKYGYTCKDDRDKRVLTSWLELLVLLTRLHLDIGDVRRLMDHLTWFEAPRPGSGTSAPTGQKISLETRQDGYLHLRRYEGILELRGECHKFTPFPRWLVVTFVPNRHFPDFFILDFGGSSFAAWEASSDIDSWDVDNLDYFIDYAHRVEGLWYAALVRFDDDGKPLEVLEVDEEMQVGAGPDEGESEDGDGSEGSEGDEEDEA